jgi:hypothetical protein
MTHEDRTWLDQRPNILGNVSISRPDLAILYAIYNRVTGQQRRVSGCGRCVTDVKKQIKYYYDKDNSNH